MNSSLVSDTTLVFARELRPVIRDPFSVIWGLIQPLFFLALFAPLLSSVSGLGTESALQWFVPGVVVMLCLFGTSTTGSNLQIEMQTGSHERLLVTPLSRSSLLIGRALKEIVPTVAQAVVIVLATVPFGFRASPAGMVTGLLILAVFCVGLGSMSYALALACKDKDWMFWLVQQTLLFPLLLLAGMLLPIDNGPAWLQSLSRANPLRYVVDAERALFNGDFSSGTLLGGVLAAVIMTGLGLWVGTRSMRSSD